MLAPWFSPFDSALCESIFQQLAAGHNTLDTLNASLAQHRNAQGLPIRCVPQTDLPEGMAYEQYIFNTGCVPTRTAAHSKGAMHDGCNALVWVHFPRTKSMLNALQARVIQKAGVQPTRGSVRDALTLFDESALVVCLPAGDAGKTQLARRHWHQLLHERRNDWHTVIKPYLFGHAVMQKLEQPYLGITAQVWVLEGVEDADDIHAVDAALTRSIEAAHHNHQLTPAAFLPLPVLGIPQWWAANRDAQFYDNTQVFRALPASNSQVQT